MNVDNEQLYLIARVTALEWALDVLLVEYCLEQPDPLLALDRKIEAIQKNAILHPPLGYGAELTETTQEMRVALLDRLRDRMQARLSH